MQPRAIAAQNAFASRRATAFHAFILLSAVICSTLAATLIGPVLPAIQQYFHTVPGIGTLVPVVLTLPMLVLGVLAAPIGWVADKVGRKRVLVGALLIYAIAGTAPLYLDSIIAILLSRVVVGVAEAAAMTCSTTLIGDFFSGPQRDRYISLQTTIAAASASIFNLVGGALGMHGWRLPFVVYAITLVIAPMVQLFIWEPSDHPVEHRVTEHHKATFNSWLLALVCVVGFFGGVVFLMLPIHFAFMLVEIGTTSPQAIGIAYAINSFCVVVGTVAFGWFVAKRLNVMNQLLLAAAVCGCGFIFIGHAHGYVPLTVGGAISGLGCGLLLPASVSWTLRLVPADRRGFGIGAFLASQSLGYFCNPFFVMPVAAATGSRFPAVSGWGVALLTVVCVALLTTIKRRGRKPA